MTVHEPSEGKWEDWLAVRSSTRRFLHGPGLLSGPLVMLSALLAAVCLLVVVVPDAWARTWRVEQDGSGDYTIIQVAVNICSPGDTVLVGPGRYTYHAPFDFGALTEDTYVVVDTPDVTLRGVDRDAVIIGPATYTEINWREPNGIATSIRASGLKVENLTVENVVDGLTFAVAANATDCLVRNCGDGFIVATDTDHVFTRCEVHDCPGKSMGIYLQNTRVVLDDCLFEAYAPFPDAQAPGGVLISAGQNVLVKDCIFKGDPYLQFQMSTEGTIENCTFDKEGIAILDSSADLIGNVFGPSAIGNLQFSGINLTATGNIFRGGGSATIYLSGRSAQMHGNHILNSGGLSVRLANYGSPNYTLDLTNNWWGTTDSTQIADWILDVHDDPKYNVEVKFVPFADQPLPAKTTSFGGLKAGFGGH